jgi:DNA-binding transcriptional LysR family regulator
MNILLLLSIRENSTFNFNYFPGGLPYFWRVALSGSITKTAEECHVSQSALSQQIKQLEDNMNVKLFDRIARQLVLTDMGKKVLVYADEIFTMGDRARILYQKWRHRNASSYIDWRFDNPL